jgi:hypothetical protein
MPSCQVGDNLAQEFEALANKIGYLVRQSCDVSARSRQAGDQASADQVRSRRKNDGDDRRRLLGSQEHASARRDDNINFALGELNGNLSGALGATLRPRYSTAIVRPSIQLSTRSRCVKASVHSLWAEAIVASMYQRSAASPAAASQGPCHPRDTLGE